MAQQNQVSFTQEQGDTAAKRLDKAHNVISGLQTRLQGHHDELMKNWRSSAAAPAFTSVFNEFNADFTKMLNALQEMHQKLSKTTLNYVSNETDQNKLIHNRMSALLNGDTSIHQGTAQ
ncbi:WXG100 family type VII secretion target [Actinoallomurus rhizosphaericola]|uniref:WXG100 family type VII secretion target n=1 Tax=Actinoallomurus rhizosphaericola TaxID=2952536 RepID=UPI002093B27C|nr:WXG100 family type VII secretion target [Actinoallomurus rhizosphaericola]MCO5996125.1 WXG100 family type VII secretion target [Actinoallomurus rhizosphaericola]